MKTILKLFFFLSLTLSTNRLAGQMNIGGGLSVNQWPEAGMFARAGYDITDRIRINSGIFFSFGERPATHAAINVDFHYIFIKRTVSVYGVAGYQIAFVDEIYVGPLETYESSVPTGINLGAGVELPFDSINMFAEITYGDIPITSLYVSVGMRFPLKLEAF
jgi:hypothetical protein